MYWDTFKKFENMFINPLTTMQTLKLKVHHRTSTPSFQQLKLPFPSKIFFLEVLLNHLPFLLLTLRIAQPHFLILSQSKGGYYLVDWSK